MEIGKVMQLLNNSSLTDKAALVVFKQIDKDRNGFITPDELGALVTRFAGETGIPTPPNFILKQALKKFDTNRDGAVSFEEFKVFLYSMLKLQSEQLGNAGQGGQHQSNQASYPPQGTYQANQAGHFPSGVQGIGQGRDAYPQQQGGNNQYQGGQGQYQGNQNSYPQQGTHQGNQGGNPSEHFPSNVQGIGQGRDAYPQTQQQQQPQYQGGQGQYQGNQGYPQQQQGGNNQYQGGQNQGGNQYQGNQQQSRNQNTNFSEHFPSNAQGIGQGRDVYQG